MEYGDYGYDGYSYYDTNSTCPEGYHLYTVDAVAIWTFYFGVPVSCVIAIFNVLVVLMFMKSQLLTPASVLFVALAVTDTISAFAQSLPMNLAVASNNLENPGIEYSRVKHEICSFLVIVEGPLYYAFHDASLLITTFLGMLKVAAIRFPIWFRVNVNYKLSLVSSIVALVFSLCLEMYPVFAFDFRPDEEGWCCGNAAFNAYFYKFSIIGQWVVPMLYLVAIIILVASAAYVAGKLTCCRTKFDQTKISDESKRRNRQSAINFVLVTVVFITTEAIDFVCILSPIMTFVFKLPDVFEYEIYRDIFRYSRTVLKIGFASNFVIYLTTSMELRNNLANLILCKDLKKLNRKALSKNYGSTQRERF